MSASTPQSERRCEKCEETTIARIEHVDNRGDGWKCEMCGRWNWLPTAERSPTISPPHHVCVCGHDMFIEYREITTKGSAITFATAFKCEKCRREISGG